MTKLNYDTISEDGKYGLKGLRIFRIFEAADLEDLFMGSLSYTEDFETYCDRFEEDMRCMMADLGL